MKIKSSITGREVTWHAPENPPEYYEKKPPEPDDAPLDEGEAAFDRDAFHRMEEMCTESLPPELYEKWVDVSNMLINNRRALKDIPQN